ncbi:hypothetical protein WDJ51_08615 [Rathayibacter sp. YIM 133350]|uniref:hypothetical protein n=1 Tax=Rathayibacter sp. YIM 133350 TaxID=3131992 RepID=UPI00307DC796
MPESFKPANPLHDLAESVPSWGTKMAFGPGITVAGQEVVPAALIIFGFGGGAGSGEFPEHGSAPEGQGEGSGGGGGGYVLPIGAYVGGPNGVKFRPNPVAIIIVSAPLLSAVGWAIARIISAVVGRPLK